MVNCEEDAGWHRHPLAGGKQSRSRDDRRDKAKLQQYPAIENEGFFIEKQLGTGEVGPDKEGFQGTSLNKAQWVAGDI